MKNIWGFFCSHKSIITKIHLRQNTWKVRHRFLDFLYLKVKLSSKCNLGFFCECMQDENEYNNEIQRRKIHFSSKSVESEKIFLQQKGQEHLNLWHDSVWYEIFYFLCPQFGFEWELLINRHRLRCESYRFWSAGGRNASPFLIKSSVFTVCFFTPTGVCRLRMHPSDFSRSACSD